MYCPPRLDSEALTDRPIGSLPHRRVDRRVVRQRPGPDGGGLDRLGDDLSVDAGFDRS